MIKPDTDSNDDNCDDARAADGELVEEPNHPSKGLPSSLYGLHSTDVKVWEFHTNFDPESIEGRVQQLENELKTGLSGQSANKSGKVEGVSAPESVLSKAPLVDEPSAPMDSDTLLKTLAGDFSERVLLLKELVVPVVVGAGILWVIALLVLGRVFGALDGIFSALQQFLEGALFGLASEFGAANATKIAELSVPLSVVLVFVGVGIVSLEAAFRIGAEFAKQKWGQDLCAIGPSARVEPHQGPLLDLTLKEAIRQHELSFFRPTYDRAKRRWNYRISAWRAIPAMFLVVGLALAGLGALFGDESRGAAHENPAPAVSSQSRQ